MPSAPPARRWSRSRILLVLATIAVTSVTGYPLCNAVFQCGCTWPLLGGDAHCNIHHAGPPDCPVCAYPGVAAAFSAVLLAGWGSVAFGVAAGVAKLRESRREARRAGA